MAGGFASSLLLLASCHSFGPDALKGSHPLYNDAINSSMNEQFIHNLVRIHYYDPSFFLDVTNVAATMKLDFTGGLDQSAFGLTDSASDIIKFSAGGEYYTQPTISFAPLQGDAFVRSLLSPIPLDYLIQLTQSGWSTKRVFGLCVERLNNLENVPTGSGPMPDYSPTNHQEFGQLLALMESVRGPRLITPRVDEANKIAVVEVKSSPEYSETIRKIKKALDLDQNIDTYKLSSNPLQRGRDTITITTRSLMSILFYLSHNVRTPKEHIDDGMVKVTRNDDGTAFDWGETPAGKVFKINYSDDYPEKGFLAIPYMDHWYYIAHNDIESKSTFMLLTQLFRLQAGSAKMTAPALTIPVR